MFEPLIKNKYTTKNGPIIFIGEFSQRYDF